VPADSHVTVALSSISQDGVVRKELPARNDCADPRLAARLNQFSAGAPLFAIAVGVSGLLGWMAHIPGLYTWFAAPVAMKPNTASCFVLFGTSLWILRKPGHPSAVARNRLLAGIPAILGTLVALLGLAERLIGSNFLIDDTLARLFPAVEIDARAGLMSPVTATAFILLGLALLVIDYRTPDGRWPAQAISLGAAAAATFGILCFAFEPRGYSAHLSLAVPTAVTMLVMALGVVCARPGWGLGALLSSRSLGGSLARRLLPAAFIPALVGWIRWQITAAGFYSEWFIFALATLISISLLAAFIAWAAQAVDRGDVERRKVEAALHFSEEQLNRLLDRVDKAPDDRALSRRVTFGVIVAVLLTLSLGLLSWRTAQQAAIDADWVTHTQQVLSALQITRTHLVEAETGGRGFAMSAYQPFLDSYIGGKAALPRDLDRLGWLTIDNSSQQQRIGRLREQIGATMQASDQLVSLRRMSPGVRQTKLETDAQLIANARSTADQIQREEESLLLERSRRTAEARRRILAVAILGCLTGVFFLVIAGFGIHRQLGVSALARAQVSALNVDLERRVEQRTAALQAEMIQSNQAIQALRESEERFQTLANSIPQLAWVAEGDGHIFWYNQRWYAYTGTTPEEMDGGGWNRVLDPAFLPRVTERWDASIAQGVPLDMEFPLLGADGNFRMFLTRVMPLKDASGRVVRWFGTNTDISELKEAERLLAGQKEALSRQSEELIGSQQALQVQTLTLRSVLDSMAEGLVVADDQGKFLIWNTAAERILGQGVSALPPEKWAAHYQLFQADMVTPLPPGVTPLERALQGESSTLEIFVRNPKTREGVWIESSGGPLKDEDGTSHGGVVAFRDITQKKTAEKQIQQLNEELEQRVLRRTAQLEVANKELEAFSYSVSHDLRAPLRHIAGFSRILEEEFGPLLPTDAQRHLQRIQEGTRRMGVLIDELLTLARVGRQALRTEVTSLTEVVHEIIDLLSPETTGRQVEWKIADLPFVECDRGLIKQVFQNLLSNALKYSRKRVKAEIEIGQTSNHGEIVIFVRDNGVGFNMDYADKLFGVFQRLHRSEDFEGTGVGLATVHRIVTKHGGRIWPEAEIDKGSTFYFTLGAAGKPAETTEEIRLGAHA
jgi:PAS domain S-box-containing protein